MWKLLGKTSAETLESPDLRVVQLADSLSDEIRSAHRDWLNAHQHFEYAIGKDQIDYAIFAIEAAEKRYEMLLRNAKSLQVTWTCQRGADVG
jgi:hypothetical protein